MAWDGNMNKALAAISEKLRVITKCGLPPEWHVQVSQLAVELSIPEKFVREALIRLHNWGILSLKTWSNKAWREISFSECPAEGFFYNLDDANFVRVRPLLTL